MAKFNVEPALVYAPNRQAWRQWLTRNHAQPHAIWLVFYKKESGQASVSYEDAVEEALCFGWIDSLPNKVDEQRYKVLFSPRKKKSPWSRVNKERIAKMETAGLMQPAGLAKIEQAKQDGSWTVYDEVEDLVLPPDLERALLALPPALEYWQGFAPSARKGILWYLKSAKRPETRQKRITQIASMAAQNKRATIDKL